MDVKKEFIRLKEQWMNSKGEAREKADVEMQAFFDSLTEKDKKLIAEAVDEDFSKIHQKMKATAQKYTVIHEKRQKNEAKTHKKHDFSRKILV